MRLHSRSAGEARTGAGAATDRLVVAEAGARGAEKQVVHRALTRGGKAQGRQENVDQALRGLDVAGVDSRQLRGIVAWRRRQKGRCRDDEADGPEDAVVERDVGVDEAAE